MPSSNVWGSFPPLQNSSQFVRNQNMDTSMNMNRPAPALPPRPLSQSLNSPNLPYSPLGYNSSYGSYGNFNSPYRNTLYGSYRPSYGDYNNYNMYGYSAYSGNDYEQRFIQSAELNSRNAFASIESVVRAFNSLAMMLDNTFFAMTSSFRAILGVAENFGRLRTMFGDIWYSVNIFRFFTWLYRKVRQVLGLKVSPNQTSLAWKEATDVVKKDQLSSSNWPTLAFLGVIASAPYIISKFLPKVEDKLDSAHWKAPGIAAKACFDFVASSPNELTIHTNDNITLAPTYIQEELKLRNTGWAYAVCNGNSGVIPLNYIVIKKNDSNIPRKASLVPNDTKDKTDTNTKTHSKRVSFGDIEIFEGDKNTSKKESIPAESTETNALK